LTEQQKTREIAIINQQLAALREQANKANATTKTHIEKRDKLNEQCKKLRREIHELKSERNRLNEKVKTLKQQRDEARTKIRTIIEETKTRCQKLTELKKKTPKKSHQNLQKEFQGIEWKIQTTSLDLQEEKRLIENVKQLETQLNVYRKIEQQNWKIIELRKERRTLEIDEEAFHQELTDTAQESQEIHANMLAKIGEARDIKGEADRMHCAYLQAKDQAKPLNAEVKRLIEQIRKLQDAMRVEDERKKKTAEQALKEKLGSQARDKLQRGEKLCWDEFQLLAEDDSQTQD
jgi:uncharacterized coiled-coil DUF342 family protein